ncbi:MAG: hypothetical protein LQ350_002459 [Teloschistes chrysophthalmus]|nr:MAG: hypothetical protein LQ350_002459 [Niorma chrysophthalma]
MSPHSAAASSAMRSGQPPQHVTIAAASAALKDRDQTATSASAQYLHSQDSARLENVMSEQSASHMMIADALAHEQPAQSQLPALTQSLSDLSQHAMAPAEADIQQSVIQPPNRLRRMTRSAARASLASSSSGDLSQQTGRSQGSGRQQRADSRSQLCIIPEDAESSLAEPDQAQQLCNIVICPSDSQSQLATNTDGNPVPNAACEADAERPAVHLVAERSALSGSLGHVSDTNQAAQTSASTSTTDAPEGSGGMAERSGNTQHEHCADVHVAPAATSRQAQFSRMAQDSQDAVEQARLDITQQHTGETSTQQAADVSTQLLALHQPAAQPTQQSARLQQDSSSCNVEGASSAPDANVASHRASSPASVQELQPQHKGKKRRARRPPKSKQPSKHPVEYAAPDAAAAAAAAQNMGPADLAASNDQPALHSQASTAPTEEQDPGVVQGHSSKQVPKGCAAPAGNAATVVNSRAPVLWGEDVYAIPCVL